MFFLSCICYAFVRVSLYVPCGHLLGKGWPLGSRLWWLSVSLLLSHWYPGSGCGTWLYRFLIFAPLFTIALISAWVKILLWIVVLKQGFIRYKNIPLCWSGADTRALENQKDIRPTFTHRGGVVVTDKYCIIYYHNNGLPPAKVDQERI